MRMSDRNAELDNWGRPMSPSARPKMTSILAKVSLISILLGTALLLDLCMAGNATDYYSGQHYTFTTPYDEDWIYSWYATPCCNDPSPTEPCCYDPTKNDKSTFVFTAPNVDEPTEVTISVVVSDKNLMSCKDMDEFKIIVQPLADLTVTDVVNWNGVTPDTTKTFTICIKGPSYPLGTEDGACKTIGYEGGDLVWSDLIPGIYMVTETNPGVEWTFIVTGSPVSLDAEGTGTASVSNIHKPLLKITCPDDKEVCNDQGKTYSTIPLTDLGTPTVDDPAAVITNNVPSNNQYPIGTTTVTWTATDAAGNKATCDQKITVKDCDAPRITCPDDKEVCNDQGKTYATIPLADLGTPTANDPAAVITNNAPSNNQYPIGTTTVTWTATDAAGNKATCDQKITVKDCEAPRITCPDDKEVCNDQGKTYATIPLADLGTPTVDDPAAVITNNAPSNNQYPIGTTTVTWTATDAAGNKATCDQKITVKDCEAPRITCPDDKEVCNDQGKTYSTIPLADLGTPTVDDPAAVITNNAPSNNQYPIGTTTVTWTATDAAGNKATCDQKITVKDCDAPRITCPDDKEVCNDQGKTYSTIPLADLGTPTVDDPAAVITNNAPSNNQYPIGTTTVTWTATDAAGNKATCDQKITVKSCGGGLKLKKTALNATVTRDQDIYFTIDVWNDGPDPLHNVTLWDALPDSVDLVYISPEPVSNYAWHIDTLEVGQHFLVDLVVIVKKTNINYDMSQRVKGEGFANVHNDYDTSLGPKSVMNCAYASADFSPTISDCASTGIYDPGTELKRRQFGSGTYANEELTKICTENKSIKTATSLSAVYKPTTFSLPMGRSLNYGTKWTDKSKARNEITNATMNEEYTSANKITKDSSVELDKNGSTIKTDVEFEGVGHIGVLKDEPNSATVSAHNSNVKHVMESQEDYVGNFKAAEYVDEYGTSVVSNKSTTGFGYVAVDKRIANIQRTYESGTGSYQSEELIDTPTSYMAKNISLVHAPFSYNYSPSFKTNQDIKWSEGMSSKGGGLPGGVLIGSCNINDTGTGSITPSSLISEMYSYLDSLKKETVASGLNEMKTQASFSGQADYRVVSHGTNNSNSVDNEERYVGKYDINRHVLLTGVSNYDMPHLTVIKEGQTRNEWYNGVLATLADYTIRITNDGNTALAPIYVSDVFPPGTQYIKSTVRPSGLWPNQANWTFINLGIGDTVTIGLTLNVTDAAPANIINRVQACGSYSGNNVCAGNYSALEFGAMTCCPTKVLVSKRAWLDALNPTMVHYSIVVANKASDSVAVTVTDQLPGGMTLLNASVGPNTNAVGQMIWVLPEIMPSESKAIDYMTKAPRDGGYTSTVHIDATTINGTSYDTRDAAAYIVVRGTGVAPRTFRYGSWEPPNWNLNSSEGESFDDIVDSFILEVEDPGSPDMGTENLPPGNSTTVTA